MDTVDSQKRSEIMRSVHNKDTSLELLVRRLIFKEGYRYRLHYNKLPGRPDIVFPSRKKVIYVNGCFWHQHDDPKCKKSRVPKSNIEYWGPKLAKNKKRDKEKQGKLVMLGWAFLIIWECQINNIDIIKKNINAFLK